MTFSSLSMLARTMHGQKSRNKMLKQLYIRNFTLIDELNITFNSGFSVITGETGAGKSIILGAIGLLLGNRADSKAIKSGCDRCVIEAHFDLSRYDMRYFFSANNIDYDLNDCIIRREINSNGKSRAFINDTPVSLSAMKDIGEQLIDIHSQHQNLLLNKEDFQLKVIDIIAADIKQYFCYKEAFAEYHEAVKQLESLKLNISQSSENEEFIRFQVNEINEAKLKDTEQEQLEQDSETLSHTEEIKDALFKADNILNSEDNGIVYYMKNLSSSLHAIEKVYPDINEFISRIDTSYIELKDISQEISSKLENVEFDPLRLEAINARLDLIYSLQHKFHVDTVSDILQILANLQQQINNIENSDETMKQQVLLVEELKASCKKKAAILTDMRKNAAKKIENEMQKRLVPLGIPNVRFKIQITTKQPSIDGTDKISFLFSANKSTPLQPVSQVASGGEIARVMLSLKAMISGAVKLPTIIFDEIDIGVSGRVAEQMAQIMQEMGNNNRQVISITHLPQIAAMGTTHYKVSKEETTDCTISHMKQLDSNERIKEIAQMLSGSDITDAAINNAKSLLRL